MKTDKKEHILYDLIYIKFWEMQTNIQRQKSDQWLPGNGSWGDAEGSGGRDYKVKLRNFWG